MLSVFFPLTRSHCVSPLRVSTYDVIAGWSTGAMIALDIPHLNPTEDRKTRVSPSQNLNMKISVSVEHRTNMFSVDVPGGTQLNVSLETETNLMLEGMSEDTIWLKDPSALFTVNICVLKKWW